MMSTPIGNTERNLELASRLSMSRTRTKTKSGICRARFACCTVGFGGPGALAIGDTVASSIEKRSEKDVGCSVPARGDVPASIGEGTSEDAVCGVRPRGDKPGESISGDQNSVCDLPPQHGDMPV
mmetsp:Transcript_804/g.2341  ORF Transcript_804/g.2341 Transcript_804/m.2341 type:complete len:125 (-) Transcript_804:74-448(-)